MIEFEFWRGVLRACERGRGVARAVSAGLPHAHTEGEEGASHGRVEAEEQRRGIIFSERR